MKMRVLVTGAGGGIGLGIAREFLKSGAEVHICDVNDELFDLAGRSSFAGCYVTNVASSNDVDGMFDQIVGRSGGLDVLVNNVGIAGPQADVEDISISDWDTTINTNLSGAFYCIRKAVPPMKQQMSGAIINISSVGTLTLPPRRSVYNVSKWAIEGLTKSLARELGPYNISCNAILPGIMNNSRMRSIMERRAEYEKRSIAEIADDYLKYSSMGRLIEVEEIGSMAVFLASTAARSVTSQLISVSGGVMYED
jgi:NAD(P)-dependent dehydrogenase (short-subunit alcohol dehydrogenase family)